jgi:hypothetical protein
MALSGSGIDNSRDSRCRLGFLHGRALAGMMCRLCCSNSAAGRTNIAETSAVISASELRGNEAECSSSSDDGTKNKGRAVTSNGRERRHNKTKEKNAKKTQGVETQ